MAVSNMATPPPPPPKCSSSLWRMANCGATRSGVFVYCCPVEHLSFLPKNKEVWRKTSWCLLSFLWCLFSWIKSEDVVFPWPYQVDNDISLTWLSSGLPPVVEGRRHDGFMLVLFFPPLLIHRQPSTSRLEIPSRLSHSITLNNLSWRTLNRPFL